MKAWRSLRIRLIFSYMILAFLLLSFVGFVFSNALSLYAISIQNSQKNQYMQQAINILNEAKVQNLSPTETLAHLQRNLPDVIVEQVTGTPPLKSIPPMKGGLETPPLSEKMLLLSVVKPGNSTFSLQMNEENKNVATASFYQFTVHPSSLYTLSNLYRKVLEVLVLALILSGLIGWILSRWLDKPLSRLAAATEAVATGNFLEMVGQSGIIELDRVTEQFNRMVSHLRESFDSLAEERDTAHRFAADAAHELKTPVATLRAYQDVIIEHPERLKQSLPAIGRQIERMEQVISGLLQIASLEKKGEFALQSKNLAEFIQQLKPNYEALAAENGQHISIVYPNTPVPVMLNRRLLELALDNLIDNACKYMPTGGHVSLALEVDISEALIIIQDTGKGISPEEVPFIFDRFRRGVDTQSIPGTGLGLAVARESIRRMSGTISVESKVGVGTKFLIRLPLQSPSP